MSIHSFIHNAGAASDIECFHGLVMGARAVHGRSGTTGTVADKQSFVHIRLPDKVLTWTPPQIAEWIQEYMLQEEDPRIAGPKGPCGVSWFHGHGSAAQYFVYGFAQRSA